VGYNGKFWRMGAYSILGTRHFLFAEGLFGSREA
jgi:hypothetical protein